MPHREPIRLAALLFSMAAFVAAPSAAAPRHPLDALTADEITATIEVLKSEDRADDSSRYPLIQLREPDKAQILKWTVGQEISRAVTVVQRHGGKVFRGVVDLNAGRVVEWSEDAGVRPPLLAEEISSLTRIVLNDERMRRALAARHIEDAAQTRCLPLMTDRGRRVRALCWDGTGLLNFFSRPLGGLEIYVDLDERRVTDFADHGARPLATADHAYDEATMATRRRLKPEVRSRPAGPNFTLDGERVRWQSWSLRPRLDPRRGLVVSEVHYWDRGRRRPVLYQGSLAEVTVPFGFAADGSPLAWTSRDWGLQPSPLRLGLDCPPEATLLDTVVADGRGRPQRVRGALAIFERWTGDPAWRHHDRFAGDTVESRPGVELVVRAVVTLGTYDYLLDWVFTQDGTIRVAVGMTGLLLSEGVRTVFLVEPTAADDTASGHLMAANIVAPHHDHRVSYRLDLDVDGPVNSFVRHDLKQVRPEEGRLGTWTLVPHVLRREPEAHLRSDAAKPGLWRVLGSARKTDVGYTPGFAVEASPHELRVTPYDGRLHDPSPSDRSIEQTDLVLWPTFEFHHLPRLEDFPVIPTVFRSFELRPYHFFEKNPAIDLRTEFEDPER